MTNCACGNTLSADAEEISEARGLIPARCEDCLGVHITPKVINPPKPKKCAMCPRMIGTGGTLNHCAECRERINQYCHDRRQRLRAKGLCIFCGNSPALFPVSPLCVDCRTRQTIQARARYKPTGRPRGRRPKAKHFASI
jgi:hypothetical protein